MLQGLGLKPTLVRFPARGVSDCQSYHFEIAAPEGTDVVEAVLAPDSDDDPSWRQRDTTGGYRPRVHLNVRDIPVGPAWSASVSVTAQRRGWLRQTAVGATAVSAALVLGTIRIGALTKAAPLGVNSGQTAALLLAIVASSQLSLCRPGEHALTSRLLWPLRLVAALSGALPYVAASTLVFAWPRRPSLTWAWFGLTVVAATCASLLLSALRRSDGNADV